VSGRSLAITALALPLAGLAAGWLGAPALARLHRTVALAERVALEEAGAVEGRTDESKAWRLLGMSPEDLYARAELVRSGFRTGGALLGLWLGLAGVARIVSLARRPVRTEYVVNQARCLSCGRCYRYCPRERLRRKGGTKAASLERPA